MGDLAHARRERLRKALEASPYERLVLADPADVFYATGYRSVAADLFRGHAMAAVLSPDDLWLVGPAADAAPVLDVTDLPADRYLPYGRFYFEGDQPPARMADRHPGIEEALGAALDRAGRERLGADAPGARLVDGETGDATELVMGVRAVKLPEEVELLERAVVLAEQGIAAAMAEAAPGVSERRLASVVAATMAEGGGDPRFVVVTSGPRSALADARATDRRLEAGDLLRFDVGCVVEGYWSDIGRTAVVGTEPDPLQATRYRAILAGEEAQLEAIRPGVAAEELFEVAVRAVEEAGLTPYRRHHCGHAIGTDVYERPIVAPGWETRLEEGMTFCLETPFYELGWGGMMVEDAVVVTPDGGRRLSRSDRSLRVVGA